MKIKNFPPDHANFGRLAINTKPSSNFLWFRRIEGLALFAFAAGTCFLFEYGQQRMLGIFLIGAVLFANGLRLGRFLRSLTPVPPELWLYSAWVGWAGVTGFVVAADLGKLWAGYRVLIQVFVMVWAAYAILRNLRGADVVFLALLAGVLIQVGAVVSGAGTSNNFMNSRQEVLGTTKNQNDLAFLMVWGAICALVFWYGKRWRGKSYRKLLILGIVFVAMIILLASGSRKSTIAFGLVVLVWAVFVRGTARGVRKIFSQIAVGFVALFVIVGFGSHLVEGTRVGLRFKQFADKGGGDIGEAARSNIRYDMYVDGLRIFSEHPIFGVGLNNFGEHFYTGQYSHSDYIEPLATTGLVGFALYQSFYFLLITRIIRLLRVVRDRKTRYRLKVYLIGIMAIMVIGLGAPHYTSQPVFLLLIAFSVSTWTLQRQLTQRFAFDSQWAWAMRQKGAQPYGSAGRLMSVRRWI